MQTWRGRYPHISPSFTCPPNKVNRTNSHCQWHCRHLTSKSPTNPIGKPSSWLWIYFHIGKSKRIINLNNIAANLGEETCKSLVLFHTLTGSDSTSAFKFTGKRSCWNILTKCNLCLFIQDFAKITDAPYCVSPSLRGAVANYVCKLYRGEVNHHNVDHLRMDIV